MIADDAVGTVALIALVAVGSFLVCWTIDEIRRRKRR